MDNTTHYSTEQLVDFLEGRLDPASSAELSKHLASGCQSCNDSMVVYKRMFSAMQTFHWKNPSLSAHRKVIQAYSAKYPVKTKFGWRPLLRPAFIGLTLLVLISFVFLFNLNPAVVYAGYVENVTGQVEMLDPTTGSWNAVAPGQSVPVDAAIRTMTDAQIVISFPGGEQTTLGSDTEIQLIALTKSQGTWEVALEQISGQTENLTSENTRSFSVRTTAGVANSSNGHFVLNVSADGSVVTRVIAGEVETRSPSQSSVIHVGETSVFPSDKPSQPSSNDKKNTVDPSPNPSPEPSLTSTPSVEPTKTPKDNGKPTRTPTPAGSLPTEKNNADKTNSSGNSQNADVTCSPGNSNGHGNSGNANNSEYSCN